jgi:acyl-coenzyme A thioesterase PaaI-like protein
MVSEASESPYPRWVGSDFQDPPRTGGGVALCGACRRAGHCSLGVERERVDDEGVARFIVTCGPDHEGGPNVAHGGWTAAVLDDCLGHVPIHHRILSVTAELTISFVKPVPVGRPVEISARVERREGRRWYISGEMVLASSGAVLARARGIWVTRDPRHFERHEQWLATQDGADAQVSPNAQ